MSKGKRYDKEPKLNYKKVVAVIVAIIVLIMFIFMINKILSNSDSGKISSETYFTVFANNKWGIINSKGETVIEPSYREMIVVPNNKKDVFLCTYDINEETGEYKTKALNSKNEEIFTQYDEVQALENYDANNNIWYEDNVLKIKKDGKYGLIDLKGNEILNTEYEDIQVIKGIKNSILIKKDGKVGLVDNSGKQIIECNYSQIKNLGTDYKEGYITITEDGKYGLISYTKNQILKNEYQEILQIYGSDLFVIKEDGKQKVVNTDGTVVLEDGFDTIAQILQNNVKGVIFIKDNKYGMMNTDGEIIIQAEYDSLKETKNNIFIAKKGDKYGIIDNEKTVKIPFDYKNITYSKEADIYIAEEQEYNSSIINNNFEIKLKGILSELNTDKGYLKIRIDDEYKYYNFKFEEKSNIDILSTNTLFLSKKDGKYGFVDKNGTVVVDYIYDDATEQNEYGYAAIKKDGMWGSIDIDGNIVIEPKYNLDNNLIIDFIGKWYLGQDINMNYYCEI